MVAVFEGLYGGLDDVGRGGEIGLAYAQVYDVHPLRREFAGAGEDGEGVFFADAVEIRGGLHGAALRSFGGEWPEAGPDARPVFGGVQGWTCG